MTSREDRPDGEYRPDREWPDREYRPGDAWTVLARGHLTVLVPSAQPTELAARLWTALAEPGADLYAVLDVLAESSGIARMPPFAVAEHGSRLRLLVRGPVRATVEGPEGSEVLAGADVGTWLERSIPAWDAVELCGAAVGEQGTGRGVSAAGLPLLGGVVAADSVLIGAPAASDDGAAPAAAVPVPPRSASEETLLPGAEPPAADSTPAGPAPAGQGTASTSYDDLWGTTVLRSVEDAAMRTDATDGDAVDVSGRTPVRAEAEAGAPGTASGTGSPTGSGHVSAAGGEPPTGAGRAASDEPSHHRQAAWTPPSLLIDAVPWGTAPAAEPPLRAASQQRPALRPAPGRASSPEASPEAKAASGPRAQSEMHYAGEGGAGHAPGAPAGPPAAGPDGPGRSITSELYGDHDGETVMRSELGPAAAPASGGSPAADAGPVRSERHDAGPARSAEAPLVLGRRCGRGHANPPSYGQCTVCGEHLGGDPVQVPRPPLGRVVLSTGEAIDLVQPLVVGRQPSVSRVASGGMPRLVTVTGPSGDISRNHLEVRLEGWHVMVRDLKATNGTVLERPGQAPRRLAQGEMAIVLDGDVADLGDGVRLRFEAVP